MSSNSSMVKQSLSFSSQSSSKMGSVGRSTLEKVLYILRRLQNIAELKLLSFLRISRH